MKSIQDFIDEDETLSQLISYEEFQSTKCGFDDSSLEAAYKSYQECLSKLNSI